MVLSLFHGTGVGAGSPDSLPPLVLTMAGGIDRPVSRRLTAWSQQNLVAIDLAGSSYQNAALKAAVCSAALILSNLKVPTWVFLIPAHIG